MQLCRPLPICGQHTHLCIQCHCCVVISEQSDLASLAHQFYRLAWVGAISHDIAQAQNRLGVLALSLHHHSLTGFEVGVKV